MPRNPDKTRCSIPDCRAWAIRGSDPPLCSPHSRRVGAPEGNQNAFVHGFYASALNAQQLRDLTDDAADTTVDGELAVTRAALRCILGILLTGRTPGSACTACGEPRPLDVDHYARFSALAFQGAGTVSRLLRTRHALGHDRDDGATNWMNQALDQLAEEWGVDL